MKFTLGLVCISVLFSDPALASSPEKGMEKREQGTEFIGKFDKNRDGKVSESEFPGPQEHFQEFDSNKDGYIDEKEAPVKLPRKKRS